MGLSPHGRGNRRRVLSAMPSRGSIPARAGEPSARCAAQIRPWVYPRTGGGTRVPTLSAVGYYGLSPHGWGNHVRVFRPLVPFGSIPARAGEPAGGAGAGRGRGVYPRTGGGTTSWHVIGSAGGSLSPHGRGNLLKLPDTRLSIGSIPARAGEPPAYSKSGHTYTVYPRTGGGTGGMFGGSRCGVGLSPHGRGNRPWSCGSTAPLRSIPARAGEPTRARSPRGCVGVYPRTGGGTLGKVLCLFDVWGLSPHGRGNPHDGRLLVDLLRSIPARAGEPKFPTFFRSENRVYPRTGGGTLYTARYGDDCLGLSPHGRGNQADARRDHPELGSIPARAGEPRSPRRYSPESWVYPRTGGGTIRSEAPRNAGKGLSPHGRGNRLVHPARFARQGSIPARAGEPDCGSQCLRPSGVYPRTGGGTFSIDRAMRHCVGLSPHGRGNRRCT